MSFRFRVYRHRLSQPPPTLHCASKMNEADPFALAQKEHPQIDLEPSLFQAHWETCVGVTNERAADIWLALGIAHGDNYALNWLKQWVHREAQKLPRMKLEQQWTSEVESRTLHLVAVKVGDAPPKIANYRGRGPLQAWLRTLRADEYWAFILRRQIAIGLVATGLRTTLSRLIPQAKNGSEQRAPSVQQTQAAWAISP